MRPRTLSQRSAPSMARTNSRGTSSSRTGNLPFTQNVAMPPPLLTERRDNPAIEAWATQDQPLSSYTFSHQSSPLQRSMSQRKSELAQVPELENVGENPADYIYRTGYPAVTITPSPISIPSATTVHRLSTSSLGYNMQTPTTPTSESLTNATTLGSNMSRENSLCNEPLLESMQMMKFNSNTSYSTNYPVDHYDQLPHSTSSRHSRRSSNEEQSQLLVGAGGVSHSQFSHSLPTQFPSSGSFGEKMEKCQSNESISSTSSTSSSRNKQRLQAQIAAARPLMPKGGSDDNAMSRENSSQSMTRLESKDGSQDKVSISKPTYQRPKHDRVFCKQCESHPEGFRGEHELRRHQDREHKLMVKKWVCIEPTSGHNHPKPVLPLSRCKACGQQKKKYGAYYNAAAHLRRTHFKPKAKGRSKNSKVDDASKRGGKAGGDWPSMAELKFWMVEVEEAAPAYPLTASQQEEADESDDETYDNSLDEQLSSSHNVSGGSFDTSYLNTFDASAMANIYPSPATDMYGMQNMQLSPHSQSQNIDSSMSYNNSSQSSFDNFSPVTMNNFQNDPLAFFDTSSSLVLPSQNSFDNQLVDLDLNVNFPFLS